ncbi:quinon protein alcohol dehydrogenase-like superfamily [Lanmaoa asiatica]|nr:quinon protein alcohol dehydrogenase-like superfamily [Lanmaoa asiatica]
MWDVESHQLVKEWGHLDWYPEVAISPDDRFIAVGGNAVIIYTMKNRQVNHTIDVDDDVGSLCFSPGDGDKLACGTNYGSMFVYDVKSGTLILGPLKGHKDCVRCVLWSNDGSRLFSASYDKTIRCWNSNTGKPIGEPWTGHTCIIRSLSLSADGSILASAAWDQTVRFWDATSGDPVGKPLQHDGPVYAVCFSPSSEFVASAGSHGKLYLWRVPWLDSVEDQTHQALLHAHNSPRGTQVPLFHQPPPPYSTHIPGSEQVLNLDLGLFAPSHLTAAALVPNSHPPLSIRDQDQDEDEFLTKLSMSDEVDIQSIFPDPSLGRDECQRIFELRLRKLV